MIKNKIISFILGLLISGLISGFVYFILIVQTLDLFGIHELLDPESRDAEFFYTGLVMTLLTVIIVVRFFRKGRKYAAIGIALPNLIGLFLVLRFGIIYFNKSNYYEKFDHRIWISSKTKPIKMARELVKEKVLIGMSKEKVVEMLGEGQAENWNNVEDIRYYTENWQCSFGLTFENGKVKTADLWVND